MHARFTRSRDDRLVAGVCGGVARALNLDPLVVRVAAVALTVAGGAGAVAYLAAWALMPLDPPRQATGAEPEREAEAPHRPRDLVEVLAIGSILLGVLLLVRSSGIPWFSDAVVWPVLLAGVGLAVIWRQASDDERPGLARSWSLGPGFVSRSMGPLGPGRVVGDLRTRRAALARVVVGVVLVATGVGFFLAASATFSAVSQGVVATAGIVAGLALITGPWWVRLGRELSRERRERIRSEERAEVAAHLHDSVLQTLALIQRNAGDPRTVVTMARRQERELRGWLYEDAKGSGEPGTSTGPAGDDTLVTALTRTAEEVETRHGVSIDVVAVGDCALDDDMGALVAAAGEAMVNAARWSGETTVSVYTEIGPADVVVFVRDWGQGFDPAGVPPDRRGLSESIRGRMARHGGRAAIRTQPGEGTEVELRMTRRSL